METIYYIGLDVHKKNHRLLHQDGQQETCRSRGNSADRKSLRQWMTNLPGPWLGAMKATIFTGWICDFLKPYAAELKVAHPEMLKAITAAKKKTPGPTRRS